MNELIFNSSVIVKICLFAIAALAIGLVAALIKISKLSRKNDDILELADTMRAELTQRRERIEKLTVEVAELKMRKVIDEEQSDGESAEAVGEEADAAADAGDGTGVDAESSELKVVLIAEDNAELCEAAANMLREAGFIAEIADNGKTAFEKFNDSEEGFYSLILMDLKMPKMNGAEAASLIRASARKDAASVPIVAMTANAFGDDLTAIEESGMNGHVSKPLDALGLIAAVREYIGKAAQKPETADDERGSKIVNLRAV